MGRILLFVMLFFAVTQAAAGLTSQKAICYNQAGELPFPLKAPGAIDQNIPIEHIVVLMQENHTFDNYFVRLNQHKYYGKAIDGVHTFMRNPDANGKRVYAYHEKSHCVADPEHTWDAIHDEWNHGAQNGFVKLNGTKAMGFFDETDLPFYYDLANKFAIADRYFCSALTQTLPNRFFLYAGTAFGHTQNDLPKPTTEFAQKTIFDVLNEYGVSWKYYRNGPGYLFLFQPLFLSNKEKMGTVKDYQTDLATGKLPQVVFVDALANVEDEHPNANIQEGQAFVASRLSELVKSSYWANSVFFLTYDEGGGFYDHVAPPPGCKPDGIEPALQPGDDPGHYDRLGFRVPFVAVSPFAKHHYISHKVYDHTSILKFIETKFNLPALTNRDANADNLFDLFDWNRPDLVTLPDFTTATVDRSCLQ